MNIEELNRKIRNLETIAAEQALMSTAQRAALRDEAQQLYDSLSTTKAVKNWALGGAAAGAILPVLGLVTGGAAGALYGAYKANRSEITEARARLETILAQLAD